MSPVPFSCPFRIAVRLNASPRMWGSPRGQGIRAEVKPAGRLLQSLTAIMLSGTGTLLSFYSMLIKIYLKPNTFIAFILSEVVRPLTLTASLLSFYLTSSKICLKSNTFIAFALSRTALLNKMKAAVLCFYLTLNKFCLKSGNVNAFTMTSTAMPLSLPERL